MKHHMKIDHTIGIKQTSIELIQNSFFGHNAIKVEMNNRKITGKSTDTYKLSNILLNYAVQQ